MYSLQLADGTFITNLTRLKEHTFSTPTQDSSKLYFQLSDANLNFAILYEDDMMVETLLNYTRKNFICENGIAEFLLVSYDELENEEKHRKEKEQMKRRQYYFEKGVDEELRRKGW